MFASQSPVSMFSRVWSPSPVSAGRVTTSMSLTSQVSNRGFISSLSSSGTVSVTVSDHLLPDVNGSSNLYGRDDPGPDLKRQGRLAASELVLASGSVSVMLTSSPEPQSPSVSIVMVVVLKPMPPSMPLSYSNSNDRPLAAPAVVFRLALSSSSVLLERGFVRVVLGTNFTQVLPSRTAQSAPWSTFEHAACGTC